MDGFAFKINISNFPIFNTSPRSIYFLFPLKKYGFMKFFKIFLLFFLLFNSKFSSLNKIAIVMLFSVSIFLWITLMFVSFVIIPYLGEQFLTIKSYVLMRQFNPSIMAFWVGNGVFIILFASFRKDCSLLYNTLVLHCHQSIQLLFRSNR